MFVRKYYLKNVRCILERQIIILYQCVRYHLECISIDITKPAKIDFIRQKECH